MKKSRVFRKTLSVLAATAIAASTVFSNGFVTKAADEDFKEVFKSTGQEEKQISTPFLPSDFDMNYTSSLGIPGYFHIFASGTYTQTTHVHGNFAAANYDGNGIDSGLRAHYYTSNIDYAQKLTGNMNITPERNFIVLGNDYAVVQNPDNTYSVKDSANNTYSTFNNKISYIAVEKDTANSPYINIASESSMLADKSRMIASATPSKFFVVKDMNNGGILIDSADADGNYVINLKYEDIVNMNQFYIRTADLTGVDGLTDEMKAKFQNSLGVAGNKGEYPLFNFGDASQTLIINIDMQGNDNRELTIRPYGWYNGPAVEYDKDGVASDIIIDREMEFNENNILKKCSNILWNFHSNQDLIPEMPKW